MENLLCCPEGNRSVLTEGKVQWVTKLYYSEDTVSKARVHTPSCKDSSLKSMSCIINLSETHQITPTVLDEGTWQSEVLFFSS